MAGDDIARGSNQQRLSKAAAALDYPSSRRLLCGGCIGNYPSLAGRPLPATGEYMIGPEDMLNVFVYRAPELSVETPVRPDGRVSTPLSPDVLALGRTPSQVAQEIESNLKKYVQEPNVTVMVTTFQGPPNRAIRAIGEVAQMRTIPYRANLSVLDVIIAANGLTRFAAGNRTLVIREGPSGPETYNVRLDDLLKDGDITQNIAMQPGDTVVVPQAWF
jgi:polysaccharide export outer membrane protein